MRRLLQMLTIMGGAVRRSSSRGVVLCATVALMLQLFSVSTGFAKGGVWIEICSDFGTEYVQVDLTEAPDPVDHDCYDCLDCGICAASMAAMPGVDQVMFLTMSRALHSALPQSQVAGMTGRLAWPETRGPPAGTKNNDDRAVRAFTATIQDEGGAL